MPWRLDSKAELAVAASRFGRVSGDRAAVLAAQAAQRVFESVYGVIERRLRLKVNREKSSIRHAAQATLLGFGFSSTAGGSGFRSPRRRSRG